MTVTQEMTDRAVKLARLELTPEERTEMTEGIERILEYMERLGSLNLDDTIPVYPSGTPENVLRADAAAPSFARESLLREAPEQDGESYLVPRAVE